MEATWERGGRGGVRGGARERGGGRGVVTFLPSRTPRRGKRIRGRSAVAEMGIGVSIHRVAIRKAAAAHRET